MNMAKEWEISYFEWQRSPNQVFGYRLNLYAPGAVKCGVPPTSDSQAIDQRLIAFFKEFFLYLNDLTTCTYISVSRTTCSATSDSLYE